MALFRILGWVALVAFGFVMVAQIVAIMIVRIPVKSTFPDEGRWDPDGWELGGRWIQLPSLDGTPFFGYLTTPIPESKMKGIVVIVHGVNPKPCPGGAEFWPYAQKLLEQGFGVFVLDHPGYGRSAPGRGRFGVGYFEWQDVVAAYKYLKGKFPKHQVGFLAKSAGTPAAIIASEQCGDFMVLESTIGSLRSLMRAQITYYGFPKFMVGAILPLLEVAWRLFLGWNYARLDPFKVAHKVNIPTMFLFGGRDPEVLASDSTTLASSIGEQATVQVYPEAHHNVLRTYGGDPTVMNQQIAEAAWQDVFKFLRQVTTARAVAQ
ncbi:alpha/beta hydrolase [candidate division WWE3 bacterium]|uniref:Alpha/beta hydrolase n=1 Tax=candidate division WWE3 bacterium TaxID=2053526 RepID=A0A955RS65_UNCKA|nr:alpha/beta hydrolase [candidate division WWE3 bacterium]